VLRREWTKSGTRKVLDIYSGRKKSKGGEDGKGCYLGKSCTGTSFLGVVNKQKTDLGYGFTCLENFKLWW